MANDKETKTFYWEQILVLPTEITATQGLHDYRKCPSCQKELHDLTSSLNALFEGKLGKKAFPLCCDSHANLLKEKDFNRSWFVNVPEMVATKCIYTKQHIMNSWSLPDYYKRIVDYVEYALESFGSFPRRCGEPLLQCNYIDFLKKFIGSNIAGDEQKKSEILSYIDLLSQQSGNFRGDMVNLINVYNQWLSFFPFDLKSYFGDLKNSFAVNFPPFIAKDEINMYSGAPIVHVFTPESFLEQLLQVSNMLLTRFNGHDLYASGKIDDVKRIKMEIANQKRLQKLKAGYLNTSAVVSDRLRRMIDEWLEDEKQYIEEIAAVLNERPPRDSTQKEVLELASIFNVENNGFEVCKGILEDTGLTIDGKPHMNKWSGRLIGIICAIKSTPGMLRGEFPDRILLNYFNAYLGTSFTAFKKYSKGFCEARDDAERYIKSHFRINQKK